MVSEVQGRETWGRECRLEIRRLRSNVEAAGMGMLTGIVRQARGTSSGGKALGAGRWALGSGQRASDQGADQQQTSPPSPACPPPRVSPPLLSSRRLSIYVERDGGTQERERMRR